MDRKKVLDVLNSLEVIETNGGDEPYILVENNQQNRELLNSVGISEEIIRKYGDDETFCILALALNEGYANYYDGKLVWLDKAGRTELIDNLLFEKVKEICENYGFHCSMDSNYDAGRIVINIK